MFLGRFCFEWSQHQLRYLEHQRNAEELRPLSLAWQASLIQYIWERWYDLLWKLQNQDVHGHDQRAQAEASRREASQLVDIYRNRNMYH